MEYLRRIDSTLAPDDGHFIIHCGETEVLEGTRPGTPVVIAQRYPTAQAGGA